MLSDFLVADPRVVRDLHAARVPHLPVRVRDGTGLVGPLVIPGVTSCLRCADLHRSDRDAAWPAVAAQLRDTVGSADRATVLATAALALNQVDRVIRAVRRGDATAQPEPPPTLDTTLEFDVRTGSIVARRWSRHPRCRADVELATVVAGRSDRVVDDGLVTDIKRGRAARNAKLASLARRHGRPGGARASANG